LGTVVDLSRGTLTSPMMTRETYGREYQHGFVKTVRLLRSRGASADDAEDLAQAAWLRGWQKLNQLKDQAMVVSWVNVIALNCHRRYTQTQARLQPLQELCGHIGVDAAPLEAARILGSCRPKDRRLFVQQMDGLTTPEIALQEGVTATAIRVRILRARRAVRANVENRASALRESFQFAVSGEVAPMPTSFGQMTS
jgi:DNA-directed RNA polymerase specialized sigma24 family protein